VGCRILNLCFACTFALSAALPSSLEAQDPTIRYGDKVPPDVKLVYDRGLKYLAQSQQDSGSWAGGQQGGGITGLCLMAFLAHGEDPNFGLYSTNVRKAVRSIILSQNSSTGFIPNSMYHHGFAMLGLAEAYGAVDESLLWEDPQRSGNQQSIGAALELAVRCAVTSQKKNSWGGWRYSPGDNNADTSVSGAVLMGLLAARNAGIEVPDECIDRALAYYRSSTSDTGMVAYSGGVGGHGASMNRSAIATLVFSVGKRRDWKEYKSALDHISTRLDHDEMGYPFYFRYYMAQALFQGDFEAWNKWKAENVRAIREQQQDDGSVPGGHGTAYSTAMSLLSLALDYRFLPIYER
jgi:hypothetical protein